jgi:hypothetical protein
MTEYRMNEEIIMDFEGDDKADSWRKAEKIEGFP